MEKEQERTKLPGGLHEGGLTDIRILRIEELDAALGERKWALVISIILEGMAIWQIPELGKRTQMCGSWSLLSDRGTNSCSALGGNGRGLGILMGSMDFKKLTAAGYRFPQKVSCLTCPQRDVSFYATGSSNGRIETLCNALLKERSGRSLSDYWMCIARTYELLGRIMDRSELQEKPNRQSCGVERDKASLLQVARYLESNYEEQHSLAEIARRHHLNEFKLKKGFREQFGTTVFGFLREQRMHKAREILGSREASVIEVANRVGYTNPSHFARAFREVHGLNPSDVLRTA